MHAESTFRWIDKEARENIADEDGLGARDGTFQLGMYHTLKEVRFQLKHRADCAEYGPRIGLDGYKCWNIAEKIIKMIVT